MERKIANRIKTHDGIKLRDGNYNPMSWKTNHRIRYWEYSQTQQQPKSVHQKSVLQKTKEQEKQERRSTKNPQKRGENRMKEDRRAANPRRT